MLGVAVSFPAGFAGCPGFAAVSVSHRFRHPGFAVLHRRSSARPVQLQVGPLIIVYSAFERYTLLIDVVEHLELGDILFEASDATHVGGSNCRFISTLSIRILLFKGYARPSCRAARDCAADD